LEKRRAIIRDGKADSCPLTPGLGVTRSAVLRVKESITGEYRTRLF
jgi:hypothetical protein